MGANAQTSVPTFTAGEILTAANMNISARTGIPVFADSTARDAAFGGTGEKTLAEGQFAYLENTNATQYYDGSNWQAVGTTPGLVCVKAETTVTAVSSTTIDNVFTSTYTNYLILATMATSSNNDVQFKFRASGTSTSTNYNRQKLSGNQSSPAASQSTGQTSFALVSTNQTTVSASMAMDLFRPQLATETLFTIRHQAAFANYTTNLEMVNFAGVQNSSTQFDGIEFLTSSGTFNMTYAIYGYSKTV